MKVTDETIDKLAHLARLEFKDEEKVAIKDDLEKILGFCEKLNELNTDVVEPLLFINEDINVLREDAVRQEIEKQDALKNAPKMDSDYFRAPKVINK
jgi:aspartyl-tRNA(Asn)/glutamyl-tRNA(Gln) amidotransferase subunit C